MKSVIILVLVSLMLICCGQKSVPPNAPSAFAEIVDVGCVNKPALTNDEIIAETTKCNNAGLDAKNLHCGENDTTIIIECRPRPL
jgi:hypothetical protein